MIISITDRDEYADVEALKQIKITRHSIISANRKIPFLVREKLVQANQQPGAERRSESAMVCAGVAGAQKLCFLAHEFESLHTQPFVPPSGREGGPRAKEGMNHRA